MAARTSSSVYLTARRCTLTACPSGSSRTSGSPGSDASPSTDCGTRGRRLRKSPDRRPPEGRAGTPRPLVDQRHAGHLLPRRPTDAGGSSQPGREPAGPPRPGEVRTPSVMSPPDASAFSHVHALPDHFDWTSGRRDLLHEPIRPVDSRVQRLDDVGRARTLALRRVAGPPTIACGHRWWPRVALP